MTCPNSNNGNLFYFAKGATRDEVTKWAKGEFKTDETNLFIKPSDGLGLQWQVQKIR